MVKKIALMLLCSVSCIQSMFGAWYLSGTPFNYSMDGGVYRQVNEIWLGVNASYRDYVFDDISDLGITLVKSGENIPLTVVKSPDETRIRIFFSADTAFLSEGTYTFSLTNIPRLKMRSILDDAVVTVGDIISNPAQSFSRPIYINNYDPRTFKSTYAVPNTRPGVCAQIGGDYIFTPVVPNEDPAKGQIIQRYTHDSTHASEMTGWVESEEGERVVDCRFSYSGTTFTLSPNGIVSTPGTYYLVYPTNGVFYCYNPSSDSNSNSRVSYIKDGPYTVTGTAETANPDYATLQISDRTFYTDSWAKDYSVMVPNAASMQFVGGATSGKATLSVTYTDSDGVTDNNAEQVDADLVISGNTLDLHFPDSFFKGEGSYAIKWVPALTGVVEAMTSNHNNLDFSYLPKYSWKINIYEPIPAADDVAVYHRASSDVEYEIGEGESLDVRLAHPRSDIKIYARWIPEEADAPVQAPQAEEDTDGFALHSADITVASPGRLEYYTVHSSTASAVKTLSFVAKPTAVVGEITNDADTAVGNLTGAKPGLYSISGVRLSSDPNTAVVSPGIYVKVSDDGYATKVIVR